MVELSKECSACHNFFPAVHNHPLDQVWAQDPRDRIASETHHGISPAALATISQTSKNDPF